MADAMEGVAALLEDADAGRLTAPADPTPESVDALLAERGADVFSTPEWIGLDAVELAAGAAQGRPRVKVIGVAAMLEEGRKGASKVER